MQIELNAVTKFFADSDRELRVIDNLSFIFPEGKTSAIVGTSGVGKTTLLNLLGGLEKPCSGQVILGKQDLANLDEETLAAFRGANIGFVFQFHHLLNEFSARENVAMPLWIAGETRELALERAEAVLERVGLKARLEHRPGQLSGGEQQRVSLARAVVSKPSLILADEPTGNLDSGSASIITQLLLEIQKETACSLVVVTHSMDLAAKMDVRISMSSGGALSYF
jgi:lipoprotein-releasing system ATP-binding protein